MSRAHTNIPHRVAASKLAKPTQWEPKMPINDLIDRLIEECRGDIHGALKALLLINERLEAELQYFYEQSNIDPPHRGTLH
jgi:hypothetical protein